MFHGHMSVSPAFSWKPVDIGEGSEPPRHAASLQFRVSSPTWTAWSRQHQVSRALSFGCSFVAPIWVAPGTAMIPVSLQNQSRAWTPWYWSLWLASSPWDGLCTAVSRVPGSACPVRSLAPTWMSGPVPYLWALSLPTESQLALHLSLQYVFDYQQGDVFGCVADIGWITGHSYVVYGPLCNGATSVLFESTPVYPDPGEEEVGKDLARHGSMTKEI